MKKIVLLFAMMLMSISGFAQAQEIVNSYKNNPGIQMIELNKGMLEMIASAAKTDEEKEAFRLNLSVNYDDRALDINLYRILQRVRVSDSIGLDGGERQGKNYW